MFRNFSLLKAFIIILLFVLCFSFSSCAGESKETYIDGTYMNDNLNVGYIFFPDGKGYQFISQDRFLIQYEISEGMITITTFLDGSSITKSFPFEQRGGGIVIEGVTYTAVADDISGASSTISDASTQIP